MENSVALVKPKVSSAEKNIISLVLDTLPSENSRRAYRRALEEFFVWHASENRPALNKALINRYLTEQTIYNIVIGYAEKLEKQGIAPHDLQRTFAKLAHKGGLPIDQIQLSLGHDLIQTTEKYLGVEQDLSDAPCDHLGLKIGK